MRYTLACLVALHIMITTAPALAVETVPRITRPIATVRAMGTPEIVERLTAIEAGQGNLEARLNALERSLNAGIDDTNRRIDDLRADMMARFDLLTRIMTLFVTIAMATLAFVLRMQWQLPERQTHVETSLVTQKDEIAFLKSLIEKLRPPRTTL